MKINRKINNVNKFILSDNNLYYQLDKDILKNNDIIKNLGENFFGDFFLYENKLVIQSFYGSFTFENTLFNGYYNYLNKNSFSFLNTEDGFIHILDKGKDIKVNIKANYYDFGNVCIVSDTSSIITAYTLPEATPLWEFDLSELGSYFDTFSREEKEYEVAKFLGVWDNQLLVALREHIILSLDIQTGKIVQKWQNIEGLFYDDMTKDLIPQASSFVLYKGKLIGALHKFYFEIDLSNSTIHFTDLSSTMEENGILYIYPINDNPIDFPNIYLTAKMKEQPKKPQWSYDCLFCLDIESKEIKWKYTFEDSSLGVKIPQYSNGKLYQLDNDNTLHIFEKE